MGILTVALSLSLLTGSPPLDECHCETELSNRFIDKYEAMLESGHADLILDELLNLTWTKQPDIMFGLATLLESIDEDGKYSSQKEKNQDIVKFYRIAAACGHEEAISRLKVAYRRSELDLKMTHSIAKCLEKAGGVTKAERACFQIFLFFYVQAPGPNNKAAISKRAYHHDSAIASIAQSFTNATHNVSYQFGYNRANQVNQRTITNIAYVFDGFKPEGTTDYDTNGLNQYTETEEAPLLANGQPDLSPAPEPLVAHHHS